MIEVLKKIDVADDDRVGTPRRELRLRERVIQVFGADGTTSTTGAREPCANGLHIRRLHRTAGMLPDDRMTDHATARRKLTELQGIVDHRRPNYESP